MPRLAVLGDGRMGMLIAGLAPEMGLEVVAHLGPEATRGGLTRAAVAGADVAIEFTVPSAAAGLVRGCADLGLPVVSGTTGWDDERAAVEAQVRERGGAMLWAPNFALGVHLFAKVVAEAARRFGHADAGFDAHLVETHHVRKLDAPSGTARLLAQVAGQARGREVPVTSVRTGNVPGTHEFIFDGAFEQVRLVHEARDRRVFAAGALSVARWLIGRRGVLTLDDYFGEVPQ
jgi:4-hydroxy-tetrahydrodipicolinate reductase